jgi:hypothetical protein
LLEPPTRAAQARLLLMLRTVIEPLLEAERISLDYELAPGVRLRSAFGRCAWRPQTRPSITVRCTADPERRVWRRSGAILATLLHETAHLKYRSHGPRFWALQRRLLDRAARIGVYDPLDHDPTEHGRGDEKLAASAAWPVAEAALQARRARAAANRAAVAEWQIGARAQVSPRVRALGGSPARVIAHGRTRLVIEVADGRRFHITPGLLIPAV